MDSEMFIIEQIEGRRVRNGNVQYYIKWAGYSRRENTWEPQENLNKILVKNYELSLSRKQNVIPYPTLKQFKEFDQFYKPDEIIGATFVCGTLLFLMKWKDTDEMNLVLAKEANVRCPQIVISFYEKHIHFVE